MPLAALQPVAPFDVQRALCRRRWMRAIAFTSLALLAAGSLLDHLGCFGWHGDDWAAYDRKSFTVSSVIDGQTLVLRDARGRTTVVQLIGVAAPVANEHWAAESATHLVARAAGKSVIVRLEPTQTRDAMGNLWAYLYLTDSDNLNADIIHDGDAYADRRVRHSLLPVLTNAESDARKHARGLWDGLKEDQMPAWRRQWLTDLRQHKQPQG